MDKAELVRLYAQKGELLTEMELMQSQLRRIDQQIAQVRNALTQQTKDEQPKAEETD